MQTTITVEIGIGGERLHHCLIERLSVVGALQNDVAVGKDTIDVTIGLRVAGNQVPFGVTTLHHREETSPPRDAPEPDCPWQSENPAPQVKPDN